SILRTDLPGRYAPGVHRVSVVIARARGLRRVPRRNRCNVVCEVQDVRFAAGVCHRAGYLSAPNPNAGPQSASRTTDLRAVSLAEEILRSAAQSFYALFE